MDYEFEEDDGGIRAITWSGGEIAPQEFQEFTLQALTPEETGGFAWNAFQTYEDGEGVEWTGPEGSEEEASAVNVAAGGAEGDAQGDRGAATQESRSENLPAAGASLPAYGGLGLGALALVLAVVALIQVNRTKT